MKTESYIASLLYEHDCVIIPDFGGFIASYQSVQLNEAQQIFYPPSKKIAFNANLKNNDGLLANHISDKENIPYVASCNLISEYVSDCFLTLNDGRKLSIDKIGLLFYDAEKNIQFIADPHQNFLRSSFGLSLIHAPVLNLEENFTQVNEIKISDPKKKLKLNWRITELIPVAAVIVLMFTFPVLTKNFDSQWSSLNPFADKNKSETPSTSKIEFAKPKSNPAAVFIKPIATIEIPKQEVKTDENISAEKNIDVTEAIQPEKANNRSEKEINSTDKINPATSELNYHIIAGCFRIEENATKFEAELKSKGFNAAIIGKNEAGLTMVSISSFEKLSEAKNSLSEIQTMLNNGAWIYKSK